MKLKVADLESEMLEDRQQKLVKYEFTVENLKSNIQG